jgi:NAD(P)H-flavin reductase
MVQGVIIFCQNGFFRSGRAEAKITHVYGAIRLRIQCRKPLKVHAGQYINLWIPSASFWSFLQSHPFVVISWAETPQDHLDLLIECRRGLTQKLLYLAQRGQTKLSPVLFSGPHGRSICMDNYEKILMVASGFGIAAQLPYLKQLIRGYNARQLRARRVHLVWQVKDISKSFELQK